MKQGQVVAVCGGSGFIGRRLVLRALAAGCRVRVLTRRAGHDLPFDGRVDLYAGDFASPPDLLRRFAEGADFLVNCAGELRDPQRMHDVNVEGPRRLIDAANRRIGRWIQLSSVGVYGPRCEGVVDEDADCRPRGVYEETKLLADQMIMAAARDGAFEFCLLRPSIVYGTDMPNRSLQQWVRMISRRLFFFVGRPGASANYIHVDNVVEALLLCGSRAAAGRVYNLSDWRTVETFVAIIAAAVGRRCPRLRLPEVAVRWPARLLGMFPGIPLTETRVDALVSRARYPIQRLESELGYTHRVSMEDGLSSAARAWSGRG